MAKTQANGTLRRVKAWFPEREFIVRSEGQVRFIKFSTRLQMGAAGLVALLASVWAISLLVMGVMQYHTQAERANLLDREAQISKAQDHFDAHREDIAATARELERRQDALEEMTAMLPPDLVDAAEDAAAARTETNNGLASGGETAAAAEQSAGLAQKGGSLLPATDSLARVAARQLAFVDRLTRFADQRARRAEQAIRTLGLDPRVIIASNNEGVGGPLEMLVTGNDGTLDPRFERLGASLARMSALERGLDTIPQVMPADLAAMSSGFGYRRDPFTGGGAMHNGLDFRAPHGSPIYATADGRISYVGYKGGYGKTIEIDHGSGVMTRYAHMSRYDAKVGEAVSAGEQIGRIGSTGRSTGPHLHFEVRINNRAVNPRPFLEKAPHVLEKARAQPTQSHTYAG